MVVVHCSAGIGRTGTYIALMLLIESINYQMQTLKEAPRISIFGTVRRLREQRYNTVSQVDQYRYIYKYMHEWLSYHKADFIPNIQVSADQLASRPT